MKGTPGGRRAWEGELEAYVRARGNTGVDGAAGRARRAADVFAEPEAAGPWWALLKAEDESGAGSAEGLPRLFEHATRCCPKGYKDNNVSSAFVRLWLGYAKGQAREDDKRHTYKTMRDMRIGVKSSALYIAWAEFELVSGDADRALCVVQKGLAEKAVPQAPLLALEKRLQEAAGEGDDTLVLDAAGDPQAESEPPLPAPRAAATAPQAPAPAGDAAGGRTLSLRQMAIALDSSVEAKLQSLLKKKGGDSKPGPKEPTDTHSSAHTSTHSSVLVPHPSPSATSFAHMQPPAGAATSAAEQPARTPLGEKQAAPRRALPGATPLQSAGHGKGPRRLGLKLSGPARRVVQSEDATEELAPAQAAEDSDSAPTVKLPDPAATVRLAPIAELSQREKHFPGEDPEKTVVYPEAQGNRARPGDATTVVLPVRDEAASHAPPAAADGEQRRALAPAAHRAGGRQAGEGALARRTKQGASAKASTPAVAKPHPQRQTLAGERSTPSQPTELAGPARRPVPAPKVQSAGGQNPAPAASSPQTAPGPAPKRDSGDTIVVNGAQYTKLECVGRGGSSKVYKVMASNRKVYALKKIKLDGQGAETVEGFKDEIALLGRLRGRDNIIQIIDSEIIDSKQTIHVVLECGDIDLAHLLAKKGKKAVKGGGIDDNFIRHYWQQMLEAVNTVHEERIVHSDLKPANFLFVQGVLKLIDFGIAKEIKNDTTHIERESQVGTLNYMAPETILAGGGRQGPQSKVGRASDVWSLGCILYQMVYGKTPFSHLRPLAKLQVIPDPRKKIQFDPIQNPCLLDSLKRCLDRNPRTRITIPELLDHQFLNPEKAAAAPTSAPAEAGLSMEQLQVVLAQLAQAGSAPADVAKLSQEVFKQVATGQKVDLSGLLKPAAKSEPGPKSVQKNGPRSASNSSKSNLMSALKPTKVALKPSSGQARKPLAPKADIAVAAAAAAAARGAGRMDAIHSLEAAGPNVPVSELQKEVLATQRALKPAPKMQKLPDAAARMEGALQRRLAGMRLPTKEDTRARDSLGGDSSGEWQV